MIKGEHDYLTQLAQRNVCAEHQTPVEVAKHPTEATYVLRCGHGEYPEALIRVPGMAEAYRQGEPLPIATEERVRSRILDKRQAGVPLSPAQLLPRSCRQDLETGELLNDNQAQALVAYARRYGLDPYRAHVCLMYGEPYISLDGYLFTARNSGRKWKLETRPMSQEEHANHQVPEGCHAWLAVISFPDTGEMFQGTGVVTVEEMTEKSRKHPDRLRSPIAARHPWLMAQKRSEWQALRRAFPIGETAHEIPG